MLRTKCFRDLILLAFVASQATVTWAGEPRKGEVPLFSDTFDGSSIEWSAVTLRGAAQNGQHAIVNGRVSLHASSPDTLYGIRAPLAVSGHFQVEAAYTQDDACGLALIHEKNGVPDIQNFTSILVGANNEGKVVVSVRDRQHGVDNVLDNTQELLRPPGSSPGENERRRVLVRPEEQYKTVLDNKYSVPFDRTNKRIRIVHDGPAGFFRFYYAVKTEIHGEPVEGWMELAPSRDWGGPDQRYYVALLVNAEKTDTALAVFEEVRVIQKPTEDQSDVRTGFQAVRRDYNWSGFSGDAIVISFDDEFPYRAEDRKFVFWSEMNYIPAWHMNNQLLYSYEFLETWGGGSEGCFEPMSDRLKRWSRVEVVEDNAVRKIVHWHYVLCDPDYKVPENGTGEQLPEADEYWTFYPDGTGVRHIVYTPKLDSDHRKWHELTELIAIAGSLTDPEEHLALPALTLLNLNGGENTYHHTNERALSRSGAGRGFPSQPDAEVNQWEQVISAAHFKNGPDAFNAFSMAADTPGTFSHYPLLFEVSWHRTNITLCHWPVGLRPYERGFSSQGTWKAEVTHTSLMGGGVHGGTQWDDHYQMDARGRKYREWISLVGLNPPGDLDGLRAKTASWLYPGNVTMGGAGCRFEGVDHQRKSLLFTALQSGNPCNFLLEPKEKVAKIVHPVFEIRNWGGYEVTVEMDGKALTPGKDFKSAIEGDNAVVWIRETVGSPVSVRISRQEP